MNESYQTRVERNEHPSVMLKNKLREQARSVNLVVAEAYDVDGLLAADGSLEPAGYVELFGEAALASDSARVTEREMAFSGAESPAKRAFYRSKYGEQTDEAFIAKWKEITSREKSSQMEMAVTLLLSEMLGNEFLVVRTAPFDDYHNGVDNLILDFTTGAVVGAFDEVHKSDDDTSRLEKKQEKIKKVADQGGANVRYGVKLENGKLTRAKLEGVPVFYLGLESAELDGLVTALRENDTSVMEKTFTKLLVSLQAQQVLLRNIARSKSFTDKLQTFGTMLMRVLAEKTP